MKMTLTAALLLLSLNGFAMTDAPQARPGVYGSSKNMKCPIQITPGRGIGPLHLGQNLADVETLGMDMKTVQGGRTFMIVGRYSVGLTEQKSLHLIEAAIGDLPNCVYFGKKKISKNMTTTELSNIFHHCKPEEHREGGNSIECDGITIGMGGWGGQQQTPSISVR